MKEKSGSIWFGIKNLNPSGRITEAEKARCDIREYAWKTLGLVHSPKAEMYHSAGLLILDLIPSRSPSGLGAQCHSNLPQTTRHG